MGSYLEKCYQLYLDKFPDTWVDPINNDTDIKPWFDKINSFIEQGFILLSQSSICGEYINTSNFKDILSAFIEATSFEFNPLIGTDSDSNYWKISKKFESLNRSLYNALRYYQSLIEFAKDKFNTENIENQYGSFRTKENTSNELNLFIDLTIPLCRYDYRLPVEDDNFQDLLIIRAKLKELISDSSLDVRAIYSVLLQKCNFTTRRIKKEPFDYFLDFDTENIKPMELELGSLTEFVTIDSTPLSQEKKIEYLEDIEKADPQLKSFVFLMRDYKKHCVDKKDILQMDHVLEKFLRFYKSKGSLIPQTLEEKYDKFSLNSVYNFINNCRFSFFTQCDSPSLREIRKELRKIEDIQTKTGVKNFHPYEKAIKAIIHCIESHLQTSDFEDRLIDEKLEELDRLILVFEESCKWSKSHRFFPFQLPFTESLCLNEQDSLKLFIPSVYAKYIDYNELNKLLAFFKQKEEQLKFYFGLSKERKEIEQLKEGIKNTDKKAIDLIALFTAAITFLFGVVNIFVVNNDANISQLIVNTSGLGIILALFMCLYILISPLLIQRIKWKSYFKTGRFLLGALGLITYASLVIILYSQLMVKQNNENTQKKETIQSENNTKRNLLPTDTLLNLLPTDTLLKVKKGSLVSHL